MKILFCIPKNNRSLEYTYENYISGCGFSGTDAQIIEMNHWLNILGHDSKIISPNELADHINEHYDVFCPSFFLYDERVFAYIFSRKNTKIIPYFQSFLEIDQEYINVLKSKKTGIIGVSDFVKAYYQNLNLPYKTIYNAINPDIYTNNKLDYNSKKGNFIFFASFERGGLVAINIFNKLNIPNKKLYICSYYTPDLELINSISKSNPNIISLQSLSKIELKKVLDKCDYFIYPLINIKNHIIHHDTFGSVILEAMACGVTVITWNVACNTFIYKDYAELIDPPLTNNYQPYAIFSSNKDFANKESVDKFVNKIEILEKPENKKYKLKRKLNARNWALTHIWKNKTLEFIDFINSF